jgi:tRNA pseudouridine38-40 synthase
MKACSTNRLFCVIFCTLKNHSKEHHSKAHMRRIALLIEYDGTEYVGWQRQPSGMTVQEALEIAVRDMLAEAASPSYEYPVVGSGRTDAGVHGLGQVAHVDIPTECSIPQATIQRALNSWLRRAGRTDIHIRSAAEVDASFHARFHAIQREYRYTVRAEYSVFHQRYAWQPALPFQPERLFDAARVFVGTHDFTTFSKHNPETSNYTCTVETAEWTHRADNSYEFRICANRYVYGMVRSIVAAMMDVARGKRGIDELYAALEQRSRLGNSQLAPPHGLVLWRVRYPTDPFGDISTKQAPLLTSF